MANSKRKPTKELDLRIKRIYDAPARSDGWRVLVDASGHAVPLRDECGMLAHYVGVLRDVTSEHHCRERLVHRACHDALTGLPNRYLLRDRLERAIARGRRDRGHFAVVFLDLDGFKPINDRHGHEAGDELLKCVAARLAGAVRDGDTVVRFGGDEFVLLIDGSGNSHSIAEVVARVTASLQGPFEIDGYEIALSCSVGLSLFPTDGLDADMLLRRADEAMYGRKRTPAPRIGDARRARSAGVLTSD